MPGDAATPPKPPSQRKAMRKGTRSCYECRIRKIRCIFAKDATICDGCTSRGETCTEQRRELLQEAALDNRESLRARIARLEGIIQASNIEIKAASAVPRAIPSERLSTDAPSSSFINNSTSDTSTLIDKASPQSIDPIVTLFDNAIVRISSYKHSQLLMNMQWRRQRSDSAQDSTQGSRLHEAVNPVAAAKHARTRQALLSNLIQSELLGMMLSATCSWWHTW